MGDSPFLLIQITDRSLVTLLKITYLCHIRTSKLIGIHPKSLLVLRNFTLVGIPQMMGGWAGHHRPHVSQLPVDISHRPVTRNYIHMIPPPPSLPFTWEPCLIIVRQTDIAKLVLKKFLLHTKSDKVFVVFINNAEWSVTCKKMVLYLEWILHSKLNIIKFSICIIWFLDIPSSVALVKMIILT